MASQVTAIMAAQYDPSHIRAFYDALGEQEWDRFDRNPGNRVNLHLHCWYLQRYIKAGDHVLDIGAGPGRFTIELAKLGARVTVGDISPRQLDLNRLKMRAAGYEAHIAARVLADVTDLSQFPTHHFDAVVCYGGPLSYVFDRADDALGELLRVTRPGGYMLVSVMSLLGTMRRFLPDVLQLARQHGPEVVQHLMDTSDQVGVTAGQHRLHYYRWADLERLLARHPCAIAAASAANFLAIRNEEVLQEIVDNPALWQAFLAWELTACKEPGALDGGTHIIVVVQRA